MDDWRDTYDTWKLATPPEHDGPGEEPCDHDEYEVDFNGRASCDYCPHSWWLTAGELRTHFEVQARWSEDYDRALRRENSRFWRAVDWLRACVQRLRLLLTRRRRAQMPTLDDDLPF